MKLKIQLEQKWIRIDRMPWQQPIEEIKVEWCGGSFTEAWRSWESGTGGGAGGRSHADGGGRLRGLMQQTVEKNERIWRP